MRVLLDTHLLLWALSSPEKLSKRARQRIDSSEVFASAASIWEVSIKCRIDGYLERITRRRRARQQHQNRQNGESLH